MTKEFEQKAAEFILSTRLFADGGKALLAVSGGADSTAILYALHSLKAKGLLNNSFICAHINHQLRGQDAQKDEDFVIEHAQSLKMPVITRRVDVKDYAEKQKLSIETAARDLRIEALIDIARENNCRIIATAHHKDDNAETIIQRLTRGTGFRGLCGIWPAKAFADDIVFARPLLAVTRGEIIEYLKQQNLEYCQDKTNYDCKYRRNFIRHLLIPEIQKDCHKSVAELLYDLSVKSRGFYLLISKRVDEIWPVITNYMGSSISLNLELFKTEAILVQMELVRKCLSGIGCGEADLTQSHYSKILELAKSNESGASVELPGNFCVLYEYGKLIFEKNQPDSARQPKECCQLQVPGQTRFGGSIIEADIINADAESLEQFKRTKDNFVEWFDLDKLALPLEIRFRREGDRFQPLGQAEEKKVGKFLTDQRVSQQIRRKVLIVADAEKIIWVWPIRIAELAKLTPQTRQILQLRITYASPAAP